MIYIAYGTFHPVRVICFFILIEVLGEKWGS